MERGRASNRQSLRGEERLRGTQKEREQTPHFSGGSLPDTVAHPNGKMQSTRNTYTLQLHTPIMALSVVSDTLSISPGVCFQTKITFTVHHTRQGRELLLLCKITN